MACKNYNVIINQLDLNNAINNSDPDLDGKVFISYTDCNGNPESIAYSTAGTYLNAFCADNDEVVTAIYWFDDIGALSFTSTATPISDCVAPTPTPSVTPSFSVTPTPSTTPLYPCNCINFTNISSGEAFVSYTRCDNVASQLLALEPNDSIVVCGSNPEVVSGSVIIDTLGTCVGKQCIPFTPTPTPSLSITPSISVTPSITPTISLTPSVTPSKTPSISVTPSNTPSISVTPSITPSNTVPPSMTPSPTISVSKTPSLTPLPSVSKTPSISVTPSITPSTGVSPTPTPSTSGPGSIPTVAGLCMTIKFGAAPSVTPSITPTNTATPSISISRTPSVTPTATPSITPSTTPSSTNPPPTPSKTPSKTPSITVSTTPSTTPSITPSITISKTPTPTPSVSPCVLCALPDVVIGTQTWTACNLDVTTYRNGDVIPQVTDPTAWNNLTTGAWCYYENSSSFGCTYNKLYNWYAVNDPRGLAPVGYHIPTEAEYGTLANYLGGTNVAGGKLKQTGTSLWQSPNTGATNETGWTGLPGGGRTNGQFGAVGIAGPYWTSTSSSLAFATPSAIYVDTYSFNSILDIKVYDKTQGVYVRLIKDATPVPPTCPLIYTDSNQTSNGSGGFYTKNYTWNPTTNVQQEITLVDDVVGDDIASTGTRLWKQFTVFSANSNPQSTRYIREWNLSGNPPYTTTLTRTLNYPAPIQDANINISFGSPGLTAKNNDTLIDIALATINGQLIYQVYELNIPAFPATQLTSTFKFNLNSNFQGQGDLMLTSDANGNPDKLLLVGSISNPTPGTTNFLTALQQYDYNTGVFEFETILNPLPSGLSNGAGVAGIGQFNNIIYVFYVDPFGTTGRVYTINQNPPYNWTLVNSTINAGGANSLLSCSKGKLVGPNTNGCDNILYKTQTNQYYSYNFSTNTSTLLNVPAAPYDSVATSLGISIAPLARTSNKLWSYTWNVAGPNNLNSYNLVEYNTTNNPFAATINRYINLPQIAGDDFKPGTGLFAISNTKLIGTVVALGGLTLNSSVNEADISAFPIRRFANGVMIVEYDISSNVATWNLKAKLFPNEIPTGDLLLTLDNKLIVLSKTLTNTKYYISQFNYNTGVLEFRSQISPTITTDCGLAEVNGEIYIMGFNVYKFNRTTYALELTQSPQTQLVASSQLASCININLPTSSCPECVGVPLKLSTPVTYVTISPTYIGELVAPPDYRGATDTLYPGPFVSCTGSSVVTFPSFSVWFGAGTAGQGNQSPYTYSLNFSEPVNDIKITYGGTDGIPSETFIWDTNVGTPNISLCKGCYQTVNGNIVSGTWQFNPPPEPISGGGIITISTPLNYTTLTLRGSGTNLGTIFGICSGSVVPKPANALGCVYYSSTAGTYLYNVVNNTSTPVTLPTDTFISFAETHTLSKYWKGNQTDTIKEWIPTSTPNVLALNRTINVSGITSAFGNFFFFLQAIDDNTLLTTIATINPTPTPAGNYIFSLVKMDITDPNVTAGDLTTLFNIYAPDGLDSILLTTNNKLLTIGRRRTPDTGLEVVYLSQYSYPDGVLEADISLASVILQLDTPRFLFEVNGNLYLGLNSINLGAQVVRIYQIDLNSPYNLTPVWFNIELPGDGSSFNSSINCNTVSLNTQPVNTLGCVYYSDYPDGQLYSYSPTNNTSVAITTPSPNVGLNNDTHTLNKFWRGDSDNTIYEWIPSNVPNTLVSNRTITMNTGYSKFWYLQAIDDNTLLTILSNSTITVVGDNVDAMLARIDITSNTVTPAQVTPLFSIPTTSLGPGSMLLTTNNKLLFVGTRLESSGPPPTFIYVLKQYSYPDGVLETEIDLSTVADNTTAITLGLFESGGEIYLAKSLLLAPISTTLYKINPTSPYPITTVWPNIAQGTRAYNSLINCNTASLTALPLTLTLSSISYCENGSIADNFHNSSSCGLLNDSPAMNWILGGFNASAVTSYEILCEDTSASNFIHWKVTGISPTQTSIAQNGTWINNTGLTIYPTGYPSPSGDRVNGWNGPCPPSGVHNYRIQVIARLANGTSVTSNYSYFTATQARNFNTMYKYLDIL